MPKIRFPLGLPQAPLGELTKPLALYLRGPSSKGRTGEQGEGRGSEREEGGRPFKIFRPRTTRGDDSTNHETVSARDTHFFTNRTVDMRNFSDTIVTAKTAAWFRRRQDKFYCRFTVNARRQSG